MGIVCQSPWKPPVNYENAMGFQLLNHAGTSGNYNTKVFESMEMREKLQEMVFLILFSKAAQVGWY